MKEQENKNKVLVTEVLAGLTRNLELPTNSEFAAGSEYWSAVGGDIEPGEVAKGVLVGRAAWGKKVNTYEVANALEEARALDVDVELKLEGLGFEGGYVFPGEVDLRGKEVQNLHAGYVTNFVSKAKEMKGWDNVDLVVVGSNTFTDYGIEKTREDLVGLGVYGENGIGENAEGELWHYSMACNSAAAALQEVLGDRNYKGKNVVIIGMESLSGEMTDLEDPITWATFGNGGGALAFQAGEDISMLPGMGGMEVEYDEKKVITCPRFREKPTEGLQKIKNKLVLLGDQTAKHFAVTKNRMMLDIDENDEGKLKMNGTGTFKKFVLGRAPKKLMEVFWDYKEEYDGIYGPLGVTIGHQPSLAVMEGFNRMLIRYAVGREYGEAEGRVASKIPEEEMEVYLDSKGLTDVPQLPWVMDKIDTNNTSAGTWIAALEELIRQKQIKTDSAHLFQGLGIGASWISEVIYFGKRNEKLEKSIARTAKIRGFLRRIFFLNFSNRWIPMSMRS